MLTPETVGPAVRAAYEALDRSTERMLESVRALGYVVCPACETILDPDRGDSLEAHCAGREDGPHAVVLVMET